jgi:Icc-related predicted phosphoesterase
MVMIIDCISDLHGSFPVLSGGNLLIVAGDLVGWNLTSEYHKFNQWLSQQDYKLKVVIAGNHDECLERHKAVIVADNAVYLCDSGCEFEGLKIWGSPWTPTFCNWYFMKDRGAPIKEKWDLIPSDTDILITHGPPFGILDKVEMSSRGLGKEKLAGCKDLRETVFHIKPKLHVFGHIHEQGGKQVDLVMTKFVNASIMDCDYNPVNQPVRVIL